MSLDIYQQNIYNIPRGNHQTVKDGCPCHPAGMRNAGKCISHSCGEYPKGVIHITAFELITIAMGAATLLTAVVGCVVNIIQLIVTIKRK